MSALFPSVLEFVISASVDVALLVAALVAIEFIFSRALTPRFRLVLWSLVALRLVVPVLPEVPVGGFAGTLDPVFVEAPSELDDRVTQAVPKRRPDSPEVAPVEARETTPFLLEDQPERSSFGSAVVTVGETGLRPVATTENTSGTAPAPLFERAAPWLFAFWLGVTLLFLARTIRAELAHRRGVRRHQIPVPTALEHAVESARQRIGLRRDVAVLVSSAVRSPGVFGIRRPTVVLPHDYAETFRGRALDACLTHELLHVRCFDIAVNGLLAVLEAAHWFNPLVRFSFRRLQAARELVRDHQAIHRTSGMTSREYARVLVDAAERQLEASSPRATALHAAFLSNLPPLTRRILMLERHSRPKLSHTAVGLVTVALVSWIGFTGTASTQTVNTPEEPRSTAKIRVERQDSGDDLDAALRKRLVTERHSVSLATTGHMLADWLRSVGVNVVLSESLRDDPDAFPINPVEAENSTLRAILDRALLPRDLDHTVFDGVVTIGERDDLPRSLDNRVYDVRVLTDRYAPSRLVDVVNELCGRDDYSWDEGGSITHWQRLLVVRQSDGVHREILALLETLAQGSGVVEEVREDRAEIARLDREVLDKWGTRLTVSFEDMNLADACSQIAALAGVNIVCPQDYEDSELSLQLSEAPLSQIFRWISRETGLAVDLRAGVIVLTEAPHMQTAVFDIRDLVGESIQIMRHDEGNHWYRYVRGVPQKSNFVTSVFGSDDGSDWHETEEGALLDATRYFAGIVEETVHANWELDGSRIVTLPGTMVVVQTPDVLPRIQRFLDAARRASKSTEGKSGSNSRSRYHGYGSIGKKARGNPQESPPEESDQRPR